MTPRDLGLLSSWLPPVVGCVATFAEILKGSPYGALTQLDAIEQLIVRPVHQDFADRAEFVPLFAEARGYLQ